MATNVDFTMYTEDGRILELTVKDADGNVVDISSATGTDIHWITQAAKDDTTNQIYKDLTSGIAITDGPNGVLQVTISDTDTTAIDASAADLTYPHQLSVEVSGRPAITMEGDITFKHRLKQVTNIDLVGTFIDITVEMTAGTLDIT